MANQTALHRDGLSDAPSAGFRSMGFRNWYFKYRYNGYGAPDNENRQQRGFRMRLASIADYEALMADAGFADITATDLSAPWHDILHDRLDMYRSLEKETVARLTARKP